MKSIDIAKFVAALWVVALHAQPLANYPLSNFIVIDTLGQLAVPFFFIASAYFFFRKPADASRVRHYLQRMGLLYAFWFCVTLPITILHAFIEPQEPFGVRLFCFVQGFFFDSSFHGSWFLMALMQAVPLCWWLSHRMSNRALLWLGVAIFLFTEAMSPHYAHLFAPFSYLFRHERTASFWNFVVYALTGGWARAFIYVVMGRWLAQKSVENVKKRSSFLIEWPLLLLLLACVAEATYKFVQPVRLQYFFALAPVITLLLFCTLLRHEIKLDFPNVRLRQWSTLFYFSHFIYVFIFTDLFPMAPEVKYPIVLALCAMTSEVIIRLSSRTHFSWLKWAY